MHSSHLRRLAIALAVTTAATIGAEAAATAFPSSAAPLGARTASVSSETDRKATVEAARAAAYAHSSATGVGKHDTLETADVVVGRNGVQHVRFLLHHYGKEVLGGDLIIHLDAHSAYQDVTRGLSRQVEIPATAARLSAEQARAKAAALAQGDAGAAQLVVDARSERQALAYRVSVTGSRTAENRGGRTVVVDATTGTVLSNEEDSEAFVHRALRTPLRERNGKVGAAGQSTAGEVGQGRSLYSGTVPLTTTRTGSGFTLKDPSHGNTEVRDANGQTPNRFTGTKFTSTDNKWGNGRTGDRATAAVDALFGVTSTLDFYQKTFGRDGLKNDGVGVRALVHYGDHQEGAFWDSTCGCMVFGDGGGKDFPTPLVALDVTAHELTHGVVAQTARLRARVDSEGSQYGEPGALNESLADIFAVGAEFATDNPHNPPNYLIGERLGMNKQKFLRSLADPALDKLEGGVGEWDPKQYDCEVHAGSGISSHAFYLLAEGSKPKTINGIHYNSRTRGGMKVEGIGRDKALQIFYDALTGHMVHNTDFHGARQATLQAATERYGQGSAEYEAVDRAWAAVNVTEANTPQRGGIGH
ncbi:MULTISPECIES: M4 family metallopeptidase [unclassified Streptomyces]|uniref:Neutral metalloproteinase n=1 Tax=Streptomyces sp. NBC_00060 TaxID=2975636 RepID=A0AAU2HDE8_9ACTN